MPIKQDRFVKTIDAGNHFAARLSTLYNTAKRLQSVAQSENTKLGRGAQERGETDNPSDILYDCFLSLCEPILNFQREDSDATLVLSLEANHFKKAAKQNDYSRIYMRRQRARNPEDFTPTSGEAPINRVPITKAERKEFLDNIQRQLYSIEKDSWKGWELVEELMKIAPKHSASDLIIKLRETGRIFHNKQTDRDEINPPTQESEPSVETESETTSETKLEED